MKKNLFSSLSIFTHSEKHKRSQIPVKYTDKKIHTWHAFFEGRKKGPKFSCYLCGPAAIFETSIKKSGFLQYINVSNYHFVHLKFT